MYLKNIFIENMGAIEKFSLKAKDLIKEDGTPRIVILVGQNGSGKTTLLSSIVDSFHRFANDKFRGILKRDGINFIDFKVSGMKNVKVGSEYGFSYLQFQNKNKIYEYIDKNGNITFDECKNKTKNLLTLNFSDKNNYKLHTNVSNDSSFMIDFMTNSYCYFPSDRFEFPYWSTTKNLDVIYLNKEKPYNGTLGKDIVIRENINQIKTWILDVYLDALVKQNDEYSEYYAHALKNIEIILSNILQKEISLEINLRTTISDRLKLIDKETKSDVLLSLNDLSAGQSTLMSIFLNIIKSSDKINVDRSVRIENIEGIILIDEVDLHLHIELQNKVLPMLIKSFPKVQFILTTHSPFFLNGMAKKFNKDDYIVVNMPSGNILDAYDDFEEVNKVYEIFEELTNEKYKEIQKIQEDISKYTKPLIITEGKTDWKHFKRALEYFKENGEFENLDIEFLEYEDKDLKMGDSQLDKLINELAKVSRSNIVIGIFDNDTKIGKKYQNNDKQQLSTHVYGLTIPTPDFRSYHNGICTEFLYKDEDLKKKNQDGRRIYLSEEFSETGRLKEDKNIVFGNKDKIQKYLTRETSKIIDYDVTDSNENTLALSKEDFAKHVLNRDEPFYTMDFEGFRTLFEEIEKILSKNIVVDDDS